MSQSPQFTDNPSLKGREKAYMVIEVNLDKILESWRVSLFSFEWLTPDGDIRDVTSLPKKEKEKFEAVLTEYKNGSTLERPILGIGVLDNVEIGSRRDVLLTLKTLGIDKIEVHIPVSAQNDFDDYQ